MKSIDIDALTADLNSLTIEEVEALEDITGAALEDVMKPGAKKGKVLRALAYIVGKRQDPDFTLEDAGKVRLELASEPIPPTDASAS